MPEIKGFWFRVEVTLQITREEVEHMIACSESHYDGKCKAASQTGGFLNGWRNQIQWAEDEGKDVAEVQVTVRQMDTLCKILEAEQWRRNLDPKDSLYFPIKQILIRMGEESERANNESAAILNDKEA